MENLSNENIVHVKKGELEYIQFRKLLEYEDILRHGIFIKPLNFNVDNLDTEILNNNYAKVCSEFGLVRKNFVKKMQVHSNNVECIDYNITNKVYEDTDGLITNKNGIVLTIFIADCISILIFDPNKRVISNIHSGWKGTSKRIIEVTLNKMKRNYGTNISDCICCMSPSIGKCHFEVKEDVKQIFENEFKNMLDKNIILNNNGKYFIDTVLINRLMLKSMGVKEENIVESNICTVCNSDVLHSFRYGGKEAGRNLSVISLI